METLHYQTRRIINRVQNNYNTDALIHTAPADEYFTGQTEPAPVQELVPELEKLFNSGHDIILETNQGYDDEGGDCYQAFLIKPEHKEEFNAYFDRNYDRDGKMLWQLSIMEYITKYPSHIVTIWAGAY